MAGRDNIRYQMLIVNSFGCHREIVIVSVAEKENSTCHPRWTAQSICKQSVDSFDERNYEID